MINNSEPPLYLWVWTVKLSFIMRDNAYILQRATAAAVAVAAHNRFHISFHLKHFFFLRWADQPKKHCNIVWFVAEIFDLRWWYTIRYEQSHPIRHTYFIHTQILHYFLFFADISCECNNKNYGKKSTLHYNFIRSFRDLIIRVEKKSCENNAYFN